MRMILGGEVDCVTEARDPNKPLASDQFVELKTNMTIKSEKDEVKFEKFKMIKFYMVRLARAVSWWRQADGVRVTLQQSCARLLLQGVPHSPHRRSFKVVACLFRSLRSVSHLCRV